MPFSKRWLLQVLTHDLSDGSSPPVIHPQHCCISDSRGKHLPLAASYSSATSIDFRAVASGGIWKLRSEECPLATATTSCGFFKLTSLSQATYFHHTSHNCFLYLDAAISRRVPLLCTSLVQVLNKRNNWSPHFIHATQDQTHNAFDSTWPNSIASTLQKASKPTSCIFG